LNYTQHLAIGIGFGLIILAAFNSLTINSFIFIALCSILPDIDHPKSKISQLLYFLVFALSFLFIQPIIQKYFSLIISIIITLLFSATVIIMWLAVKPKHRGLTHSLAFALVFMLIAVYFEGIVVGVAGFFSYVSHIIADKI
jgi:inner membrane protein